jgi:hypothetical protein
MDLSKVRTLASRAQAADEQVKLPLGCLEPWRFILLQPGKRSSFGTVRGIRADWPVRLTASGEMAIKIWPPDQTNVRVGDDSLGGRLPHERPCAKDCYRQLSHSLSSNLPFQTRVVVVAVGFALSRSLRRINAQTRTWGNKILIGQEWTRVQPDSRANLAGGR